MKNLVAILLCLMSCSARLIPLTPDIISKYDLSNNISSIQYYISNDLSIKSPIDQSKAPGVTKNGVIRKENGVAIFQVYVDAYTPGVALSDSTPDIINVRFVEIEKSNKNITSENFSQFFSFSLPANCVAEDCKYVLRTDLVLMEEAKAEAAIKKKEAEEAAKRKEAEAAIKKKEAEETAKRKEAEAIAEAEAEAKEANIIANDQYKADKNKRIENLKKVVFSCGGEPDEEGYVHCSGTNVSCHQSIPFNCSNTKLCYSTIEAANKVCIPEINPPATILPKKIKPTGIYKNIETAPINIVNKTSNVQDMTLPTDGGYHVKYYNDIDRLVHDFSIISGDASYLMVKKSEISKLKKKKKKLRGAHVNN